MQHGVLASSVITVEVAMLVYPRYQSGITTFGDDDGSNGPNVSESNRLSSDEMQTM